MNSRKCERSTVDRVSVQEQEEEEPKEQQEEEEPKEEQEEEDFFDCQEVQDPGEPEDPSTVHCETETRLDRGGREEELHEEGAWLNEEWEELEEDSDLKENLGPVECDDSYQKKEVLQQQEEEEEEEEELTEEEKESRRQQSLTLKEAGNAHFKAEEWREAELSYTEALSMCPRCFCRDRSVFFSNRAAARSHLDLKESAILDCTRAIELYPEYVRALLRRAELHHQTDKLDEALDDYKKVLDLEPGHCGAKEASMIVSQQIQERNEKLKEEMLGKLKDLGNLVLRPFGLSTNNFQVNQDQASGSYSINFVQNPNNNNR